MRFLLYVFSIFIFACGPARVNIFAQTPVAKRTLDFSGYEWNIKAHNRPLGPGPNYFSASADTVRVDESGRLRVHIREKNGRWLCGEVICTESLGYGIYLFRITADVASFHPNVVAGLFTWHDGDDRNRREIDIELSKWGDPAAKKPFQYVVQPAAMPGHLYRFALPPDRKETTHVIEWRRGTIIFYSFPFHLELQERPQGTELTDLLEQLSGVRWEYKGPIPVPDAAKIRINFYLFGGQAPVDAAEQELIVDSFQFFRSD